jgi:hypothetical protein
MPTPPQTPEDRSAKALLERYRRRYAEVNRAVRGDAQERNSHQSETLEDWREHRKKASE